jgi:hypothetical protein
MIKLNTPSPLIAELQRKIPHDPRIDVVPGSTMRDFMILFQDFYDPNELFNFLLDGAVFIGGELGNPDCWFVPPHFIRKYWFLCPNHRPTRPDNSVELAYFIGDRMMEALNVRKEMYIDRENHADAFPQYSRSERSALDDNGNVRKGKSDKLKEERKGKKKIDEILLNGL